ncbi:MAG TPA: hypothetical protein VMC83_38405 [Streptosporangiaceae bacterium]|nr:hypothetical protein [Streptosporangiaceae bacterium]
MIGTGTADSHEAGTAERERRPRGGLAGVWRSHKDVLGGAGSLVASTAVTSGLGFAFWAVAARFFPQQDVGYGSAATSAMALLGTFGMFGLGTVLIAELPRRSPRAGLMSAALLTSGIGSLIIGLGFALIAPHFSRNFVGIGGTPYRAVLFSVGVALTGVGLVFDQGTIGLLRGGLQLSRNMAFTTAKLLALPVAAFLLHHEFGVGIDLAWIFGIAVSFLVVAVILRIGGDPILPRPDWDVLRGLGKTAMAHNWLNIAISVPWSVIPVLVTVVVSPTANAAFYAAWTLSGFLYVIPTHLSTVLFAVAAGDVKATARKLRFTLKLSVLIGVPGMIVLGLGAHLALSLFGPGYASLATVPLWLLVLGYLPAIPRMHYIAVCRAKNNITKAAVVLTSFSAAEIAAAAAGGALHGLNGLSVALLAVFTIEAIAVTPAVLSTAMGRGRHRGAEQAAPAPAPAPASAAGRRRAEPQPAGAAEQPVRMPRPPARLQPIPAPPGAVLAGAVAGEAHTRPAGNTDIQEAGLAALLSMSGFVSRTGPIPIVSDIPPVPREARPGGVQHRRPQRLPRPPDRAPSREENWPRPAERRPDRHERWPEQQEQRVEHDGRDEERDEQDLELASLRSLAMYATQTLPLKAIRDYVPPDRRDAGRSRRR